MKPLISITDQELMIDTDQYKLLLIFKQQPGTELVEAQPATSNKQPEGHPDEIIVTRSMGTKQPASLITPNQQSVKSKLLTRKLKTCPKCKKSFKPIGNAQVYCSEACGMKPKFYKSRKSPGKIDLEKPNNDKKRQEVISQSPDTGKNIPVRIDNKTTIYIKPGQDPETAKERFLKKLEMFEID